MKNKNLFEWLLRLALSVSYFSAVADRFGFWGKPGTPGVVWGNWKNFVDYSNSVNSFVPDSFGNAIAVLATIFEIVIPVLLVTGYKLKYAALGSGILLTAFALAMTVSFGIKTPLDYSVFTGAAASFLLTSVCVKDNITS